MTNTQLKGEIFNLDGINYLVMDDNDWLADRLRVKTIDAGGRVTELRVKTIFECLARRRASQPIGRGDREAIGHPAATATEAA